MIREQCRSAMFWPASEDAEGSEPKNQHRVLPLSAMHTAFSSVVYSPCMKGLHDFVARCELLPTQQPLTQFDDSSSLYAVSWGQKRNLKQFLE